MKKVLVILIIAVIYYFTIFQLLLNTFGGNMVVFLFSNLICFAMIYQWFKGQLYQL
ncbi:MAG: hypothetical protein KAW41_00260 [Candidatus Diapherotrites archaeon]|nr:hypothetical protein [Candidatus Diapherotrites archaeon]